MSNENTRSTPRKNENECTEATGGVALREIKNRIAASNNIDISVHTSFSV